MMMAVNESNDNFADEVKLRWGHTQAFAQSQSRTSKYRPEDYRAAQGQAEQAENLLLDAFLRGNLPSSTQAKDAAKAHQDAITNWYYDCSDEIHVGLAEMYLLDERFKAHYENIHEGLAQYVHDAIIENSTSKREI